MNEHIYQKGSEMISTNYKIKWWQYLLFLWTPSVLMGLAFYEKPFVDLINDKGIIRRVYVKGGTKR